MASYEWTGAEDGNLSNPNNYDPVGVPGPEDTLLISASQNQPDEGECFAGTVNNWGAIYGGVFHGDVLNNEDIQNGTFHGAVDNPGYIWGGVFHGDVTNHREIVVGTFHGTVYNNGTIFKGAFHGSVYNERTIWDGTFHGYVENRRSIDAGRFYGDLVNEEGGSLNDEDIEIKPSASLVLSSLSAVLYGPDHPSLPQAPLGRLVGRLKSPVA